MNFILERGVESEMATTRLWCRPLLSNLPARLHRNRTGIITDSSTCLGNLCIAANDRSRIRLGTRCGTICVFRLCLINTPKKTEGGFPFVAASHGLLAEIQRLGSAEC